MDTLVYLTNQIEKQNEQTRVMNEPFHLDTNLTLLSE